MESFASKFTLYDILAMIVPGAVLTGLSIRLHTLFLNKWLPSDMGYLYDDVAFWISFIVASYLVGIILNIASERLFYSILRCSCLEEKARLKVDKSLKVEYNEAWYFVTQISKNSIVFILEAQVAFIRNMILPMLFMVIYVIKCSYDYNDCHIVTIITGCCSLLFPLIMGLCMVERQIKIYKRVFEDYKYLKRLGKNKENEEDI